VIGSLQLAGPSGLGRHRRGGGWGGGYPYGGFFVPPTQIVCWDSARKAPCVFGPDGRPVGMGDLGSAAAAGAAQGAVSGAVAGSVVPGIGTAIGAVVGAAAGYLGGKQSDKSKGDAEKLTKEQLAAANKFNQASIRAARTQALESQDAAARQTRWLAIGGVGLVAVGLGAYFLLRRRRR